MSWSPYSTFLAGNHPLISKELTGRGRDVCEEGGQMGPVWVLPAQALGTLKQGEKLSCLPPGGMSFASGQVTSLPSYREDLQGKRSVL